MKKEKKWQKEIKNVWQKLVAKLGLCHSESIVKRFFSALIAIVIAIALFSALSLAIPNTLNIMGKLTDDSGTAITGTINVSFRIYDSFTGGTRIYVKQVDITPDSGGIYDTILEGINTTFPGSYYLGIAVGNDSESTPRVNLTPTPYAFRANISDDLTATNAYVVASLNVTSSLNVTGISYFTGNVGIGAVSAQSKLQVGTGAAIDANISGLVYINSTHVGIGTSSPGSYYSGADNLVVAGSSTETGITIYTPGGASSDGYVMFANGTSAADMSRGYILYDHDENAMVFFVDSGSSEVRIDSSGNLGIGDKPNEKLTVFGNINATGNITAGASSVFIDGTNSKVGIGTVSPSKKLEVNGTSGGISLDPDATMPVINTTVSPTSNLTITSSGGSVIIRLG